MQAFPEINDKLQDIDSDWDISAYNGHTIHSLHYSLAATQKWALLFSHPDSSVPTRVWYIQAVVTLNGDTGQVRLCTDVSYSVAVEADPPLHPIPGFVGQITNKSGLLIAGNILIRASPYVVGQDLEVPQLVNLLVDPQRSLPVVVLSAPDANRWNFPSPAPEYLIRGKELSERCFGMGLVVELPYSHAFSLSDQVGRNWSVFDGGVRIYRPGLDLDEDDIYSHPLFLKHEIMHWNHPTTQPPQRAFEIYLKRRINTFPIFYPQNCNYDTFNQVHQERLEHDRVTAHMDARRRQISYEEQIAALKQEVKKQQDTAESVFADSLKLEEENARLKEDLRNLSAYKDSLLHAIKQSGQEAESLIPIPTSYDEMDSWCKKYFPDRLHFTTRARRAIKDPATLFDNVHLVYQCLLLLANEYWEMRTGNLDASVFDKKCENLQVENRPAATKTQAGMAKEEYYYTDAQGKKHLLDMHITRGRDHNPHAILRIYYYWDSDKKMVVIGSLTNHLTTQSS